MGTQLSRSQHRLLGTVLLQLGGKRTDALEGSVFVAGILVKWLRDQMGWIDRAADTEAIARATPDNCGVYLLPALAGLRPPHWRPYSTGTIVWLTLGTTRDQLVRAAMESSAQELKIRRLHSSH